jgi:hypothetical protein
VESWARRTRFTAVVVLSTMGLALVVFLHGIGAWLSGMLMVLGGLWYWLPVVLRTGRRFAEGYRSES